MGAKPQCHDQHDNYTMFSILEFIIALAMIAMVCCVEICRSPLKYMRKTTMPHGPLHSELKYADKKRRLTKVDKYQVFTVLVIVVALAMMTVVYAWI